jgi:hypothetical protein
LEELNMETSIEAWRIPRLMAFLVLWGASIATSVAYSSQRIPFHPDPPGSYTILGVPFIAWREAARWVYPDRDIINPSLPATASMSLTYWHPDLDPKQTWGRPKAEREERFHLHSANADSLADIKGYLANGIPVSVNPALTPWAHPAN